MLLSRTSQYAIQAMICLATVEPTCNVTGIDIAQRLNIPTAYLAKVMQLLARANLVWSTRGVSGGFCLSRSPEKITMMDILSVTEHAGFATQCLLGMKGCSKSTKCPIHDRWQPVKQKITKLLQQQTLQVLGEAVLAGKYRLETLPQMLQSEFTA